MTELATALEPDDVLVPLDQHSAERLDKRLRLMAGTARDNFEKVGRLLDEAKRGQVHEVLGFKSWTAYVADAVGGQLQLSGDARQAMVGMLAGEGMSVRAIAAATGVSKSTVDRDLAQVSHDGTGVIETDPKVGVPQRDTLETVSDEAPAVTGLDGKSYSKPKRKPKPSPNGGAPKDGAPGKPDRRVQVPTAYREKVKSLTPIINELVALTTDPRWEKATTRFSHQDRIAVEEHIETLQALRRAMGSPADPGSSGGSA